MVDEEFDHYPQNTDVVDYVERMIEDVHGESGVELFNDVFKKLREQNPDVSLEEVIRTFEQDPTPDKTSWFRLGNLERVAFDLVERVNPDGKVRIGIVGCSTGEEAWSLAVLLEKANHQNTKILATDVSPDRINTARIGRYNANATPQMFEDGLIQHQIHDSQLVQAVQDGYLIDSGERWTSKSINPKYSLRDVRKGSPPPPDFFKSDECVVMEPQEELRGRVAFGVHDIIDGPLSEKQDIIIVNHILLHFPDQTRSKMLKHIIESLNPGGFVVMEPMMKPMRPDEVKWLESYNKWRREITQKFPLHKIKIKTWWNNKPMETDDYFQLNG